MSRPYRLARRSFLCAVGGAFGLKTMLDNLEASAEQAASPPRFLMLFWPLGTVRYHFLVEGTGFDYTTSRILQPFEDAGLREEMIALYGLSHQGIDAGCGGGAESGTVMASTGTDLVGTRSNGGEADDGAAGGPSFDQIFQQRAADLSRPDAGPVNAICDARVDSQETSARCLSYGYQTRQIEAVRVAGRCNDSGTVTEAVPLLPTLRPLDLYVQLFGGFMPGGAGDGEQLQRALRRRRSVLDFSLDELARIKGLAPREQHEKLDQHAEVIRRVEQQLSSQLETEATNCEAALAPAPELVGEQGSSFQYGNERVEQRDDPLHRQIGATHLGIIRAAFQCDLTRVATFQWAPATSHVSFGGLFPEDPDGNYLHHPMSHRVADRAAFMERPPTDAYSAGVVEFLTNVQTWYNTETAAALNLFKSTTDVFGAPLLDQTIVPFITDKAEATDSRAPLPALVFGGRALGMQGGQALNFETSPRSHNDLWMSLAQAYLKTDDPLALLESEVFFKTGVAPIDGLWRAPG